MIGHAVIGKAKPPITEARLIAEVHANLGWCGMNREGEGVA